MDIFSENTLFYLTLLSFPLIAAIIGWITNYIAVKMIFRPRKEVNILGIKFLGLVPKRQKELAKSVAEVIDKELISSKDFQNVLTSSENIELISGLIETQLDKFIKEKLAAIPMIGMFLEGEVANNIKTSLTLEIKRGIPELIAKMSSKVDEQLNIKEIIQAKIEEFEISKLENIINKISSKELKTIEILGGVLGFFVGLFQSLLFLLERL